jgi:hypothetical protein
MNIYEIVDPEFKKEIEESRDLKLFPAGTVILDIDSYVNYIPLMSGVLRSYGQKKTDGKFCCIILLREKVVSHRYFRAYTGYLKS